MLIFCLFSFGAPFRLASEIGLRAGNPGTSEGDAKSFFLQKMVESTVNR